MLAPFFNITASDTTAIIGWATDVWTGMGGLTTLIIGILLGFIALEILISMFRK